jgi:tripartite-type tricarboxylate transporter receptor subunit TctC
LATAAAGTLAAAFIVPGRSLASDAAWPNRPVRFVVGYPAGASTDICARILAEDLRTRIPQPVVVENRSGANGSLGAAYVATSPPDGHTLLVSNTSTMTANHLLYRDIRYHPLRDLMPIATVTISPFILAIGGSNPRTRGVKTLADLVALAKRQPDGASLTYASGGIGNLTHLNMEVLCGMLGVRMLHVPYRGAAPAETALVAGEVDLMLETPTAGPLFKAGNLTPIATTGPERWRDLPEVPTIAESGHPDFVATFWNGLVAPAGTPAPIVERLHNAMEEAAQTPQTRQLLLAQGDVMVLGPEAFRERVARDIDRNAEVIRRAGIEPQ